MKKVFTNRELQWWSWEGIQQPFLHNKMLWFCLEYPDTVNNLLERWLLLEGVSLLCQNWLFIPHFFWLKDP